MRRRARALGLVVLAWAPACAAEPSTVVGADGAGVDASGTTEDAGGDATDGGLQALDAGPADGSVVRFHPPGFLAAEVHGRSLTTGAQDCRACHGADLTGGVGPSCDGCHPAEWRTTCTFCHGGAHDQTGAPPRDLRGSTVREEQTFRAHPEHVALRNHAPYDCTECHTKPTDVLSGGHVFDDTPGLAEVTFENGVSAGGVYEGRGACSNLYCHGTGRRPGAYDHERTQPTCDTCHAGPVSTRWTTLSGQHARHLQERVGCYECHSRTADSQGEIQGPTFHVNGQVDLDFASGAIGRTNGTCTGSCHGERHSARVWQ